MGEDTHTQKPLSRDEVLAYLKKLASYDLDPHSGRMWAHVYQHGIGELWDLAHEAFLMFLDKTMLNFTVYPSIIEMERELLGFVSKLLHGGRNVVGSFTYGGTESIMVAVKAAREYFREKKGKDKKPEIVLPKTGHPAFWKAAEYLDMKVVLAEIDKETYKVDVDSVQEKISDSTALIVGSAPNYPFGTIDDIKALGDIAVDKDVWLHVDACMGGLILPFFKKLGENVPPFDFEVEGVYSISADLHKYGYAPKGASVVLYREKDYKLGQLYVNANWPGYPLVNESVLSTRSEGSLAAAWAVVKYLGEEGYIRLARSILNVRNKLANELKGMGFRILGPLESSLLSFTHDEVNVFYVAEYMKEKGWYLQVQPGSAHLGFPRSLHLTISPVHEKLLDDFIRDIRESLELSRGKKPEVDKILKRFYEGASFTEIMGLLGFGEGKLGNMILVNELMHQMPPEIVENMVKLIVNEMFKPKLD